MPFSVSTDACSKCTKHANVGQAHDGIELVPGPYFDDLAITLLEDYKSNVMQDRVRARETQDEAAAERAAAQAPAGQLEPACGTKLHYNRTKCAEWQLQIR